MVDELVVAEKKHFLDYVPVVGWLRRKAREQRLEEQRRSADQDALVRSQAQMMDEINQFVQLLNGMTNSLTVPDLLDDFEALKMPSASSGVELYRKYFSVLKSKHEAFLDYLHVLDGRKVEMKNRLNQFHQEVEKLDNFMGVLRSKRVQKIKDILTYEMGMHSDSSVKAKYRRRLGELEVIESNIKDISRENDGELKKLRDSLTQKFFILDGLLGEVESFDYEKMFADVGSFLDSVKEVHYDDSSYSDSEILTKIKAKARELEAERKRLLTESKVVLKWVRDSRKACLEAKVVVENELPKFKRIRESYGVQRNKLIRFIKGLKKEALVPNISHYAHIYDSMISLTEHFMKLCEVYKKHENAEVFYRDKMLNTGFPDNYKCNVEDPFFNYRVKIGESFNILKRMYDRRYLELVVADPNRADELKKVYDNILGYWNLIVDDFTQHVVKNIQIIRDDYAVGRHSSSGPGRHNFYFRIANSQKWANLYFLDSSLKCQDEEIRDIVGLMESFRDVLKSHRESFLKLKMG